MKYHGMIGFAESIETAPGVYVDVIIERPYSGDVNKNYRRFDNGSSINGNVNISNEISVLSDPYANRNIHAIRYLTWQGNKWIVSNVQVVYPRLYLTLGGLWNA